MAVEVHRVDATGRPKDDPTQNDGSNVVAVHRTDATFGAIRRDLCSSNVVAVHRIDATNDGEPARMDIVAT